jgi:gluconolactonase
VLGDRGPIFALTVVFLLLVSSCGDDRDDSTTSATNTTPTAPDPLVDHGEVELVADGYVFTEGPQWMPDGALLFTDYGNIIYRLGPDDQVTSFRVPSNQANGLAVDPEGRLLAAERLTRRITRTELDGTITTIAERFEGSRLNQPNDIAVRSDGTIYFTDPLYEPASPAELDFHGVFRIAPDGSLTAERRGDTDEQPNGVVLSPDETRLYVANWAANIVWSFDVAADGSLSEAETFVSTGDGPDGITVDTAGNLFVTTEEGIEAFAPDGSRWGAIELPNTPANCAFGDADARTLYITAESALYRIRLAHPGLY